MGVTPQIVDYLLRPGEWRLGVDDPLFFPQDADLPDKFPPIGQGGDLTMKAQFTILIPFLQMVEIGLTELFGQGFYPEQIRFAGRVPPGSVKRPGSGGNQTMQMKMIDQRLGPGVQHADKAQLARHTPPAIGGKGLKGFIDAAEQIVQQLFWIAVNHRIEIIPLKNN